MKLRNFVSNLKSLLNFGTQVIFEDMSNLGGMSKLFLANLTLVLLKRGLRM